MPSELGFIVRMVMRTTSSGDPMLVCQLQTGRTVNVFKDGLELFREAGYGDVATLSKDSVLHWYTHPVPIRFVESGRWLNLHVVEPRSSASIPDAPFMPNARLARRAAIEQAQRLLRFNGPIIVDTETTGVDPQQSEPVQIGALHLNGDVLIDTLVKPAHPERMERDAVDTHGISPERLANAPTLESLYDEIDAALHGRVWVGYNIAFDSTIVEFACWRANLPPILPMSTFDVMPIVSMFFGEWDTARQRWSSLKLVDAAHRLDADVEAVHSALGDCRITLNVLQAIARSKVDAD